MDKTKLLVVSNKLDYIRWYHNLGKAKMEPKNHHEYDEQERLLERMYKLVTNQQSNESEQSSRPKCGDCGSEDLMIYKFCKCGWES